MYKDETISQYLDKLASRAPVPGGGSAAALVAALGASLLCMAARFTIGNERYAQHFQDIEKALKEAERLRATFLEMVDLDAQAYEGGDLKSAFDVPFRLCRICVQAMGLCEEMLKKANPNLVSDVIIAGIFLESSFFSSSQNVFINLRRLGNEGFSKQVRKELSLSARKVKKARVRLEALGGKIIRR